MDQYEVAKQDDDEEEQEEPELSPIDAYLIEEAEQREAEEVEGRGIPMQPNAADVDDEE